MNYNLSDEHAHSLLPRSSCGRTPTVKPGAVLPHGSNFGRIINRMRADVGVTTYRRLSRHRHTVVFRVLALRISLSLGTGSHTSVCPRSRYGMNVLSPSDGGVESSLRQSSPPLPILRSMKLPSMQWTLRCVQQLYLVMLLPCYTVLHTETAIVPNIALFPTESQGAQIRCK